jgi:hypothetical protein
MFSVFVFVLTTLRSSFRTRAALQLEILALRHLLVLPSCPFSQSCRKVQGATIGCVAIQKSSPNCLTCPASLENPGRLLASVDFVRGGRVGELLGCRGTPAAERDNAPVGRDGVDRSSQDLVRSTRNGCGSEGTRSPKHCAQQRLPHAFFLGVRRCGGTWLRGRSLYFAPHPIRLDTICA